MFKKSIPSLFTFTNLALGILSILFTFNKNYSLAALFVIISAIMDRYDGRIARKFSCTSLFGKELDSLSDLISFGTAPAILSWGYYLKNFGVAGYIICIIFPIAGAFRLARYNISEFNNVYTGIPITIAGAVVALDIIISIFGIKHDVISLVIFLLFSYLMVCNIKIKKM